MGALYTYRVANIGETIVNADGTTKQDILTGLAAGTRVESLFAATDETANRDIQIWIKDASAVSRLIGTIAVPLGSGNTSGVPPINLLDPAKLILPPDGVLLLQESWVLQVSMLVAVTAAKNMYISGQGGHLA